jgi:hypothetical protein
MKIRRFDYFFVVISALRSLMKHDCRVFTFPKGKDDFNRNPFFALSSEITSNIQGTIFIAIKHGFTKKA